MSWSGGRLVRHPPDQAPRADPRRGPARITRAQVPSRHSEVDLREQYRELVETPVRWVRLT